MNGVPCIRGLRIPVATILRLYAEQVQPREILELYPDLEIADLQQALAYAAHALEEREIFLAS